MVLCGMPAAAELAALIGRFGMELVWVADDAAIPGSFWGDSEAGLIGNRLLVRRDTPVHSALHEACHYICMDDGRRRQLHTDAAGGYDEENGVCYLQILLAERLPGYGRSRILQEMDSWGYSFRLGSAAAWFEQDAEDARDWLFQHRIIGSDGNPLWQVRY